MILGLILIAIAVLVFIASLFAYNDPATLSMGSLDLHTNGFVIFLIGAGTVVLLVVGLEMFRSGTGRKLRRRRERKDLERQNRRIRKERAREEHAKQKRATDTDHRTTNEG